MDIRYRHEWKHVINYADLLTIRTRMRAVARSDPHAIDGKYLIRSLYFDNIDDKALREKIDGVNMREKFRIRTYKTIKGKSFYSSWSKAKATKLKTNKENGKNHEKNN